MVLTAQLRRRLNYYEQRSQSSSWMRNSATDYSGIVMSYTVKVVVMLFLLCADIGFNSSVDHDSPAGASGVLDSTALTYAMVYFGAQIVVQILTFVVFFLLLCGTYLFRVGLIGVLSKYFKGVMAVTLIYLVLTGVVGGLRLAFIGQSLPFQQLWDYGGFTAMSIIHKLFATLYYIVNIRTAIQIGDPKFYTKEPWVQLYREGNNT